MGERDFTGHAAFRETLHGPQKLEIDAHTADIIEGWLSRFEAAVERMEYAASSMNEAGEKMQFGARSMGEAAGTMDSASRRIH